jgi:uridine kinase
VALQVAIDAFIRGECFSVHSYDNRSGTKALEARMVGPAQVLIVEGIHALHAGVAGHLSLKVFIDSDEQTLRQLRLRANQTKRGMNVVEASVHVSAEWHDYMRFVKPRAAAADWVVMVDKDHGYSWPCRAGCA